MTELSDSLSTPDWRTLLAFAHDLADRARAAILPHFRAAAPLGDKGGVTGWSPVTAADLAAEDAMRARIAECWPDHGIVGEEREDVRPDARVQWILDPIDGTKAFLAGFPVWGVLVAVAVDGEPVVGLIDQPVTGERFVGHPDGAFVGDRRLAVRPCPDLASARLQCTEPGMFAPGAERAAFDAVADQAAVTRFGGDCYGYAMLAHGLIDLIVEADLKPWDVAALVPVVRGAGGIITGWDGGPPGHDGRVIACGDPAVHRQACALLAGVR